MRLPFLLVMPDVTMVMQCRFPSLALPPAVVVSVIHIPPKSQPSGAVMRRAVGAGNRHNRLSAGFSPR